MIDEKRLQHVAKTMRKRMDEISMMARKNIEQHHKRMHDKYIEEITRDIYERAAYTKYDTGELSCLKL